MKSIHVGIAFTLTLLLLLTVSLTALGEAETGGETTEPGFYKEAFSLGGYLVQLCNLEESDCGNILYLRLKGDWKPAEHLSFHTEFSYDYKMGNQNPHTVADSYGLAPLDPAQYPLTDFHQGFAVDHVWGLVNLGRLDLQYGKMPMAWGTGYVWNPTARVTTSSFLDGVSEETPGTFGVKASFAFTDAISAEGYLAFQDKLRQQAAIASEGKAENLPYGLKLQGTVGSFDLSCGWIKEILFLPSDYQRRYYLSADFAGAVGDFGVYGEGTLNLPQSEDGFSCDGQKMKDLVELVLGFDYVVPGIDLSARTEYYHQGPGETDPSGYNLLAVLSGERTFQGEDYGFLYLEKSVDKWQFTGAGLMNLHDLSGVILPGVTYRFHDEFQLSGGGIFFFGETGTEFDGVYHLPGKTIDLTKPGVFLKCKLSF